MRKSKFCRQKIDDFRNQPGTSLALHFVWKGAIYESRQIAHWVIFSGSPFGKSGKGFANDNSASSWEFAASDKLITDSTDFCYAGTAVDPTTGEAADFYNLCSDDLDLASDLGPVFPNINPAFKKATSSCPQINSFKTFPLASIKGNWCFVQIQ